MTGLYQPSRRLVAFLYQSLMLWLMGLPIPTVAQGDAALASPDYTVTKRLLSIENGLASHEVFCGLQDSSGFMWFGTRNGLNRYDGKNSLLFTRQRNGLQDNKVVQLARDDADNLFIEYGSTGFRLTTNGKVDVMNAATRELRSLTAAFPNLPFKERDVYWISNDGTEDISFLTASPYRLWKYSSKKGFRLRFEMKSWDKLSPVVDNRATGAFCAFMKGKALLKLNNQAEQYLVDSNTVITYRQHNVLRSLHAARAALQEGRNRVRSIALIHQNLYQFENLSSIDLKRFVNDLCRQVQSVFQMQKNVLLMVDVPVLDLDIDSAVPLGLILNELLSNSFKYAFADLPEGKIDLIITPVSEGKYQLKYTDNGPGLPSGFGVGKATTLGLQLINDLTRQIGGRIQYEKQNGASSFTIHFTNREVRKNVD